MVAHTELGEPSSGYAVRQGQSVDIVRTPGVVQLHDELGFAPQLYHLQCIAAGESEVKLSKNTGGTYQKQGNR